MSHPATVFKAKNLLCISYVNRHTFSSVMLIYIEFEKIVYSVCSITPVSLVVLVSCSNPQSKSCWAKDKK